MGTYGIALRKEDEDLARLLDEALAELVQPSRAEQIYRRWRIWNEDQSRLAIGDTNIKTEEGAGGKDGAYPFSYYAPLLLQAAGVTVFLAVASMAVAMTIGLIVAVMRLYGPLPIQWLALGYVEFFRGIPVILLLMFLYFGLPSLGINLNPIVAAILGFGLNYAAYEAEIYRSSIQSVAPGQWEAARALGMNEGTTFRRVIFPQAFRTALGPMTNDFVAMFKETSVVSVIAQVELAKQYEILAKSSLKFVELGLLTAGLYLAMSVPLGYLSRWLEHRTGIKHH
jgi:polar amino acid transport system substrate-binding protein